MNNFIFLLYKTVFLEFQKQLLCCRGYGSFGFFSPKGERVGPLLIEVVKGYILQNESHNERLVVSPAVFTESFWVSLRGQGGK